MKKLADFGLDKIPTEVLLSMARTENGELKAYITELEDKLVKVETEFNTLKAYIESDAFTLTVAEKKEQLKELRKEDYIKELLRYRKATENTLREVRRRYKVTLNDFFDYINNLERVLEDNGIEKPARRLSNPNSGDLSFLECNSENDG